MFRTISLGTCVSVQGRVVKMLKDGRLTVQVGQKYFTGRSVTPMPVQRQVAAKQPQLAMA